MIGAGGLVVSIIVFAVGAVLDWAITEPYQHGFNLNKVGWILMIVGIVGIVGAVVSVIVMVAANTRRRRTVVNDGQGNVVRASIPLTRRAMDSKHSGIVNGTVRKL